MQIYTATVKLLGDDELEAFGLCMRDRVTLRQMCTEAVRSKYFLYPLGGLSCLTSCEKL